MESELSYVAAIPVAPLRNSTSTTITLILRLHREN